MSHSTTIELSVIIPLYNEETMIQSLHQRVEASLQLLSKPYEIIYVNDGSKDATLSILLGLRSKNKNIKIVSLSRNFGHQAAYTAGLHYAKGNTVIMMDGDLQDPPELIPEMYSKAEKDELDVVYGSRSDRRESWFRKLAFGLFHILFKKVSRFPIEGNAGNFCLMNRAALEAFLSLTEKNRYLPGIRAFIGFRQGSVSYVRESRGNGSTKMPVTRLFKLAIDALFSFSSLPIRICVVLGLLGIMASLAGGSVVVIKKINGEAILGWTSVMLSIYFLGSVQLFFLGVIGEYIHRIFVESQNRPLYIVNKFYE
jgi:glycosyltransferase involved in cell wall biosynthesis